jgi:hypothetical protein
MTEQRDLDLGARLEELDVREHDAEYWTAVMAAAEPELERLRAAAADEAEPASPRRLAAAFIERHPAFGRGSMWWATAAVAAAVTLFLLLGGLPGSERASTVIGPAPATAAEAIGYALTALDRYPGIEGAIVSETVGDYPAEWWSKKEIDFVADPDGSLRIESRLREASFAPRTVRETLVYDAPARTSRVLSDWSEIQPLPSTDPDGGEYYPRWWLERSGMAAAEPDRELLDEGFPLWRVRAYLRAMLSDPEARFIATEQDGRTVWVLSAEAVTLGYSGDRPVPVALPVTITIDAATRLPLAFERAGLPGSYPGEVLEFDIRPLSEAPARDRFTLLRPDDPGTHIEDGSDGFSIGGDQGFRDLPLDDAAAVRRATSGMAAFPQWLPRGFSLSSGTFKDEESGVDYRLQPGAPVRWVKRIVVSQIFRRGFDQAFVSIRVDPRLYSSAHRGTGKDKVRIDTSDPFVGSIEPEVAALWASHTDDVRLTGGWFAGETAHVVLEPETWPHLWVKRGPYVACVAGDVTKAQMVRIANSLESWKAPEGE